MDNGGQGGSSAREGFASLQSAEVQVWETRKNPGDHILYLNSQSPKGNVRGTLGWLSIMLEGNYQIRWDLKIIRLDGRNISSLPRGGNYEEQRP